MNNDLSEIPFVIEKLLSDPQKIIFALLIQRRSRLDAGMGEKEVAARK